MCAFAAKILGEDPQHGVGTETDIRVLCPQPRRCIELATAEVSLLRQVFEKAAGAGDSVEAAVVALEQLMVDEDGPSGCEAAVTVE